MLYTRTLEEIVSEGTSLILGFAASWAHAFWKTWHLIPGVNWLAAWLSVHPFFSEPWVYLPLPSQPILHKLLGLPAWPSSRCPQGFPHLFLSCWVLVPDSCPNPFLYLWSLKDHAEKTELSWLPEYCFILFMPLWPWHYEARLNKQLASWSKNTF